MVKMLRIGCHLHPVWTLARGVCNQNLGSWSVLGQLGSEHWYVYESKQVSAILCITVVTLGRMTNFYIWTVNQDRAAKMRATNIWSTLPNDTEKLKNRAKKEMHHRGRAHVFSIWLE